MYAIIYNNLIYNKYTTILSEMICRVKHSSQKMKSQNSQEIYAKQKIS